MKQNESELAGTPGFITFRTLGDLLLAERFRAYQMVSITFGLGVLMLYYMLYRSKLILRFIS